MSQTVYHFYKEVSILHGGRAHYIQSLVERVSTTPLSALVAHNPCKSLLGWSLNSASTKSIAYNTEFENMDIDNSFEIAELSSR